jgi:hypothetical protein
MALLILIAIAWLVVVFFGFAMCRLAALSDHAYVVALAEWLATSPLGELDVVPAERPAGELPFESHRGLYRATG